MTKPVIGLPGRRKKGRSVQEWPDALGNLDLDLYIADYATAVLAAGGLPFHIPFDVPAGEIVDAVDGIVLTGGADLDPGLYGAAAETDDFPPEPIRDEFELAILDRAIDTATPVLGICRGLQLINVAAGGTLHQHVEAHAGFELAPSTELHDVEMRAGSRLEALYGTRRSVNSLHHQTVDEVGRDLVVSATSPDGTVEGLEHESLPVLAVQWHPEMMTSAADDPIFGWIVECARSTR